MKHPIKCLLSNALVIILLSTLSLSGCVRRQPRTPQEKTTHTHSPYEHTGKSNQPDIASIISYCATEKSAENRIYFNYPQFKATAANNDETNALILKFVESALRKACDEGFKGNLKCLPESWKWSEDEYSLQAMDVHYTIRRNDANYLSITFEGLYFHKNAAHPIHYFNSLTINVRNNEVITLSDLYHIDEGFCKLVRKKFNEQYYAKLETDGVDPIDIYSDLEVIFPYSYPALNENSLVRAIQLADRAGSGSGFYSFMTNTALGISVPLSYAIGDHFEVMIPYDELDSFSRL